MKQDYDITTPNKERVFTRPGKNGPNDMKIFSRFPTQPWPHSLFYAGLILRLKAEVEDRNYPPPAQGATFLFRFIRDCIFKRDVPIGELCKQYKIEFIETGFEDRSQIAESKAIAKEQGQQELFPIAGKFLPRHIGDKSVAFDKSIY